MSLPLFAELKKGKPVIAEGKCHSYFKMYVKGGCGGFVEVAQFVDDNGSGPDITEMFKFIPGKKYRITVEKI